jgi:hypothetical protein
MDPKIQPSLDFLEVEPSTTGFTFDVGIIPKTLICDTAGVATITSNAGTAGLFNLTAGQPVPLRGNNIIITTDATCRIHVYL